MAIKIEVIDVPKNEYPCLKISNKGIIVEFTSDKTGRVETENKFYSVGYESDNWSMQEFKHFTGKLVKSNI